MLWLLCFEIEIEGNHWPIALIPAAERIFNHRANPLEEILLQCWFVSRNWSAMCDDRPRTSSARIGVPERILLDRKRRSRRESAVNPVSPPFKVRIAVVRIHQGASARLKCGMLRSGVSTKSQT